MSNDPSVSSAAVVAPQTGFFGHPRGLATLFFTEFWERFSYYGMRALLILYMTTAAVEGGLGFDTPRAGAIYGLYTSFAYLVALPGGWIADRLLGQRRSVLIGGIVIAAGHFCLAFQGLTAFYLGLMLIVVGTGFLKPNISTMVGELYPEGGARRDAGFSIFYMGINLGAFVAPLICGYLGQRSWHWGFAAAGFGMVFGVIQYALGGKHLGTAGLLPDAGDDAPSSRRNEKRILFGAVALLAVLVLLMMSGTVRISVEALAGISGFLILSLAVSFLIYQLVAGGLNPTEKKRVIVIFVLFIFSVLFWAGFEQGGSSLNLFADRLTDRVMFGREVPAATLQAVNPLLIISLAPVFAWLWISLSRRGKEPSSPAKFSMGLVFLGLGFAVMVWASMLAAGGQQVSPVWLVLTYFFHTCGELCLSPVGLSTVTKLAPHRKVGQMMGIFFMSIALGNLLAGLVAGRFESLPLPQLFGAVAATTIVAGVILALLVKPIRRMMSGVH